ncbi:hypothetical protein NIES4102_29030 [Chondrocystis sp. NIES-4102]|nr:hypothetical protein NIES4102_29030 [Chondrocystis sp. NIES-4102]
MEQKPSGNTEYHLTNEDIDTILESYRQQNKQRPIGLAKGKFTVPDEILDLFNNP